MPVYLPISRVLTDVNRLSIELRTARTFTFTKEDADNSKPSKSHYYVRDKMLNANRPKDWTSPVDYRNAIVTLRGLRFG